MRISDWSSDVCSSDLVAVERRRVLLLAAEEAPHVEHPLRAPQARSRGRGCGHWMRFLSPCRERCQRPCRVAGGTGPGRLLARTRAVPTAGPRHWTTPPPNLPPPPPPPPPRRSEESRVGEEYASAGGARGP